MLNRDYTSYEEINRDLEILRLERDLSYHRIIQTFEKTKAGVKQSFAPMNLIRNSFQSFSSINKTSGIKTILITAILRFVIKKFLDRK
ncbi:MAG: hypothetical protein KBS98_08885 [Flavobacterium sp.]|nr:hypothetical protein [Candidatus Neoflavobacterium equi]